MSGDRGRIAFGPEALSRFNQILEEVSLNLVEDGLAAEQVRSDEVRRKLAQRLLGFASHWWTDTQIKQLLLRTLRNQISASRQHQTAAGVETRKPFGENQFGILDQGISAEASAARIDERDGNQLPARQLA
jgi:hypothetical protein